jgi:hypothetical protein
METQKREPNWLTVYFKGLPHLTACPKNKLLFYKKHHQEQRVMLLSGTKPIVALAREIEVF